MRARRIVELLASADAAVAIALNHLVRGAVLARAVASVAASGLAGVEVVLMGALAVAGRRSSAGRMLVAVALVYVGSELLGRAWQRERPFATLSDVEALLPHTAHRSFPSRHVASGLAMAAVGGRAHPRLSRAMWALAWLLGVARVAVGLHYPSDVFAGAVLGTLIGRLLRA